MRQTIEYIYSFVFFAMVMALPFFKYITAVPNILLLVLFGLYPFVVNRADFQKVKDKISFLLYIVFAVYLILISLVFSKLDENLSVVLKVFSPLAIIFLSLPLQKIKYIQYGIICSSLAAITFSVVQIGILIFQSGTFEFGTGMNPVETLPMDRIYLGLLCLISIIISYRILKNDSNFLNGFHWVNITVNILFLVLIVSRMAIITLLILIAIRFFFIKFNLKTFLLSLGSVLLVALLAFGLNDNIKKRFLLTTSNPNRSFKERLFLMEPRTKIWDCAVKIAPKGIKLITGLGFETTIDQLVDCYAWNIAENPDRRDWYISQRYNTHNQFLGLYLGTGIISFLMFFMLFVVLFIKNRKDYFSTALLITIFFFALVENFLNRQVGAYYFGLILAFLLINHFSKVHQPQNEILDEV